MRAKTVVPAKKSSVESVTPNEGNTAASIRIFLIDDHTIVRQGVRALLAATRDLVVVGEAADGESSLSQVAALAPDVVVVDLSLPGMHGTEVVRRLKAETSARVVVLSMHAAPEVVESARRAGCDAYVVKGGDVAELAEAIRAAAAGQSYVSRAAAPRDEGPLERLSARERQILALIAQSGTNKTIAAELGISVHTVNAHRTSLMAKLDIHDAQALTRFAVEHGLIAR
jgi:DNA-binding NarL/FixJ family response regulator